jgi:hypothetical protein
MSDEDEWEDIDHDMVPPVVHAITVNSSGTRFAVAHSRGADVYALFGGQQNSPPTQGIHNATATTRGGGGAAGPSPPHSRRPQRNPLESHMPPLAPRPVLSLTYHHLNPSARPVSDSFDDLDDSEHNHTEQNSRGGRRRSAGGGGVGHDATSGRPSASSSAPAAGVGLVALLYETNVLAVVGGGTEPCQPPNRVLLFNGEYEQQRITLLGPVARVVLQNRRVIALSQTHISIHSFSGEKLFEEPATGWCVFSPPGAPSVTKISRSALSSMLHKATGVPSGAAGKGSPLPPANLMPPPNTSLVDNGSLVLPSAPVIAASQPSAGGPATPAPTPSSVSMDDHSHLKLRRMPMDVASIESNALVAYPDPVSGYVAFCDWLNASKVNVRIAAHRGDIDNLALTRNGEALITGSDTNTVLRVWNTTTGAQLREVRLSSQPRTTYLRSLGLFSHLGERPSPQPSAFRPDYALALDSKGELKFFYVGGGGDDQGQAAAHFDAGESGRHAKNQGSLLSTFQFVSSYFASEWHACSVTLPFLPPINFAQLQRDEQLTASTHRRSASRDHGGGGHSGSAGTSPHNHQHHHQNHQHTLSAHGSDVVPLEGCGWFELSAAVSKYVTPAQAAEAARRSGPQGVTVAVLTASGVVARVAFGTSSGRAELSSRTTYQAAL